MRRFLYTLVASVTMLVPALVATGGPATAALPYTVTALNFKVMVGPNNDQACNIVGDLYVPNDASSRNRMPAVLTTNGFGGQKADQAGLSKLFASRGYVALSYSGLGFGGSSCKITLDDPDFDGKAAAQLIDFLGGATGIAFSDDEQGRPVTFNKVKLDGPEDPRVGMFGVSYAGEVQYAAASVTPKLDAIVPIITWNDLSYSLAPNNTDQFPLDGQEFPGVSTTTPGVVKQNWALGFSALGLTADAQNGQAEVPAKCPNFADFVCLALITGAGTGTLSPTAVAALQRASVASYQDKVKVPTLLLQGQADTLFNLNEAVATYRALKAQGTTVKMSWVNYGHSGKPAPGEIDFAAPNTTTQLVTRRIFNWFERYLKDRSVPTGPEFSYYRDWVNYTGIATKAYASSDRFPVGVDSTYLLSSDTNNPATDGKLVTNSNAVTTGTEAFEAQPGPISTAQDFDVVSGFLTVPDKAETDVEGTFARYDTDELTKIVDVVGSPIVRLQVEAPTVQATQGQDTGKLVLFLNIADVDENGKATVVRNLVAPVRLPDAAEPFTVTMPAFVHRFDAGHKIRLTVAGGSPNYRGNNVTAPVTIRTVGGSGAQSITLPIVAAGAQKAYDPGPDVPRSNGGGPAPNRGNGSGGDTGNGGGSDGPGAPANNGNGTANGSGNSDGKANGNGAATPRDVAQAGAAVTDSSVASTPLPDTGGPPFGLLGGGLLLLVLGALVLLRRRRSRAS